jgi:hypothetical protein
MELRNKRTSWTIYNVNNEGEKILDALFRKNWYTGTYDSNIDTIFLSLNDNPDDLYLFYIEENLYDSYGNYVKYSRIGYDPPDETGHQTMSGVLIYKYDYHYTDYGEFGMGCDTSMLWGSKWDDSTHTYDLVFYSAEIITQFVGLTGIDEINDMPKMLTIAPNPVSGIVTISATDEIQQLHIFDITGRLVSSQSPANKQATFDTGVLPQGIYLVQALLKDGRVQTGKVVVR